MFFLPKLILFSKNQANSHSTYGWQKFTDQVIRKINANLDGVVFLLWGNFAQKKASFVDNKRHAVVMVSCLRFAALSSEVATHQSVF